MKTKRHPVEVGARARTVSCPAQVHSALINIAALIAHSILNDRASLERVIQIPTGVCALIAELLLWEAARLAECTGCSDLPRERLRAENYELLGQAMRAFAGRTESERTKRHDEFNSK